MYITPQIATICVYVWQHLDANCRASVFLLNRPAGLLFRIINLYWILIFLYDILQDDFESLCDETQVNYQKSM